MDLLCSFCGDTGIEGVLPLQGGMDGATCAPCFRQGIAFVEEQAAAARTSSMPCAYCRPQDRSENPLQVGAIPICELCAEVLSLAFTPDGHRAEEATKREMAERLGIRTGIISVHHLYPLSDEQPPDAPAS